MILSTTKILKTVLVMAVIFVISSLRADAEMNLPQTYAFQRAMEAIGEDKLADAVDWLNKEVSDNPDNGYAYFFLAVIYNESNENGRALQNANTALKKLPKKDKEAWANTYYTRANSYLAMEDTIKALDDYAQAIKYNPTDLDYYKERAQIYYEQGKYDLADADYSKMLSIEETNVVAHMGLGRNQAARKNYSDAVDKYTYVIKLFPDYSAAYSFRAEAYIGMEKWNEAIDDIIQALDMDINEWARTLARKIDPKYLHVLKARYKVMIAKQPNEMKWPYFLGEILYINEDYREAARYFLEANKINSWATCLENASQCYNDLGDYEVALEYIDRAMQLDPERQYDLMSRASILYNMGDFSGAIKDLDKYIETYPSYWYGYTQRGKDKFYTGADLDGAVEDLTMAIILEPNMVRNYIIRGRAYQCQGKNDLALEDFANVLELEAQLNLTPDESCSYYAYYGLDDYGKAKEVMEKVLESSEDKKSDYYEAACLYSLMGEKDKAIDFLRKSLESGYIEFAHIKTDPDLANIRDLPEFQQLVEEYIEKFNNSKNSNIITEVIMVDEEATVQKEDKHLKDDDILEDDAYIVRKPEDNPSKPNTSPSPSSTKGKTSQVPFTKEGGVTKVKCSINELPLYFVFDTGASDVTMSMVEANFMVKNDYIKPTDVVGTQRYIDANGDVSEGTILILRKVNFGGLELENVRASVVRNQKAPLLLGQSVLGRLGKVEIDNVQQVINITR